jgi:hypothetical protein
MREDMKTVCHIFANWQIFIYSFYFGENMALLCLKVYIGLFFMREVFMI